MVYKIEVPELASLALRLLNTLANSVPAEKFFLAMNRIQDEDRNAMALEKYNKAMYIAMNERAFARVAILLVGEIEVMAIVLENTLIKDFRA
jgi:predicted GTPase